MGEFIKQLHIPRKIISQEYQEKLDQEPEEGSIEYKLHLASISGHRLEKFKSQLKWRVAEGHGHAIYYIGVEDKGLPLGISEKILIDSVCNLQKIAKTLKLETEIEYIEKGTLDNSFCVKINILKKEVSENKSLW